MPPKKIQKYAKPKVSYKRNKTYVSPRIEEIKLGQYNTPMGKGRYSSISGGISAGHKFDNGIQVHGSVENVRVSDKNPYGAVKKNEPNANVKVVIPLKKRGGAKSLKAMAKKITQRRNNNASK